MTAARHVAPERLIEVDAGRASPRETARVDRHVAACARCAAARERLARARDAMTDIAAQQPPELGWDHIGARVYWSTSSARHRALREAERPWWRRPAVLVVASVGLAAATTAALALWPADQRPGVSDAADRAAPPRPQAPKVVAGSATDRARSILRGVVTFASGQVALDGTEPRTDGAELGAVLSSEVEMGARLRTGEGRLVIQFGQASGFALGPHSSVTVGSFDDRAVELVVYEGAVEVELSHRRADQTFVVVAGHHRVSVVGTAFQVAHRAGQVDVECARGRVMVSDGASEVPVSAGEQLKVLEEAVLARALRQTVDPRRLAALERSLARPLLPAWTASPALLDTSSTVELAAPAGRAVRVDGVEVGVGTFALRVMSGRHHLQVSNGAGGFGHGAWIDAEPRARHRARAGLDGVVRLLRSGTDGIAAGGRSLEAMRAGEPAAAARARRLRRRQLTAALGGSARARQCMVPLEKRDLVSGSNVLFDIGFNADGSQGHLNVIRSNVPPDVERCLRAVVDEVQLPDGPAATVRFELAF